ncbi:GGDEF domain-containing protein [Methylobacterium oryzihabitans]|nr:GGDEF domain-containing protein [Methylobacterium oryzihabitans]
MTKPGRRPPEAGPAEGPANVFSLFDHEEALLARTEVMLANLGETAAGVRELAEAYRRGYREQSRLVRLSDRMQADLQRANQRLSAQQRTLQSLNEVLSSEIEHRIRLESELRRLADTDPLTGALARRRFLEVCEHDWGRRENGPCCLMMLDLDHFKRVNDGYGHAAGDAALVAFVAACRANLRPADAIGRLGGEEFAILLAETGLEAGRGVAERVRAATAATPVATPRGPLAVSVSVGLVEEQPGERFEDALKRADGALYAAKHDGRDRVRIGPAPDAPGTA